MRHRRPSRDRRFYLDLCQRKHTQSDSGPDGGNTGACTDGTQLHPTDGLARVGLSIRFQARDLSGERTPGCGHHWAGERVCLPDGIQETVPVPDRVQETVPVPDPIPIQDTVPVPVSVSVSIPVHVTEPVPVPVSTHAPLAARRKEPTGVSSQAEWKRKLHFSGSPGPGHGRAGRGGAVQAGRGGRRLVAAAACRAACWWRGCRDSGR